MIILPPRRDSEKDTLANYTTGAAVEKKNKSQYICVFPLFYTHTPLNWYPCRLPCRTVTSVKNQIFIVCLSVQSTVGIDFDLPN